MLELFHSATSPGNWCLPCRNHVLKFAAFSIILFSKIAKVIAILQLEEIFLVFFVGFFPNAFSLTSMLKTGLYCYWSRTVSDIRFCPALARNRLKSSWSLNVFGINTTIVLSYLLDIHGRTKLDKMKLHSFGFPGDIFFMDNVDWNQYGGNCISVFVFWQLALLYNYDVAFVN